MDKIIEKRVVSEGDGAVDVTDSSLPDSHKDLVHSITKELTELESVKVIHYGASLRPEELLQKNKEEEKDNDKLPESNLTGSSTLVEISRGDVTAKYIIDLGAFQGIEDEENKNFELPFNLEEIDAIFVTHAHLDHIGRIPYIFKYAREKNIKIKFNIYMSEDTYKAAELIRADSARINSEKAGKERIKRQKVRFNQNFGVIKSILEGATIEDIKNDFTDKDGQINKEKLINYYVVILRQKKHQNFLVNPEEIANKIVFLLSDLWQQGIETKMDLDNVIERLHKEEILAYNCVRLTQQIFEGNSPTTILSSSANIEIKEFIRSMILNKLNIDPSQSREEIIKQIQLCSPVFSKKENLDLIIDTLYGPEINITSIKKLEDKIPFLFSGLSSKLAHEIKKIELEKTNGEIIQAFEKGGFSFDWIKSTEGFLDILHELKSLGIEKSSDINQLESFEDIYKKTIEFKLNYFNNLFPEKQITPSNLELLISANDQIIKTNKLPLNLLNQLKTNFKSFSNFDKSVQFKIDPIVNKRKREFIKKKLYEKLSINDDFSCQESVDKLVYLFPEFELIQNKDYIVNILRGQVFNYDILLNLENMFPTIFKGFPKKMKSDLDSLEFNSEEKSKVQVKIALELIKEIGVKSTNLDEEFLNRATDITPSVFDVIESVAEVQDIMDWFKKDSIQCKDDIDRYEEGINQINGEIKKIKKIFGGTFIPNDIEKVGNSEKLIRKLLIAHSGKIYDIDQKANWVNDILQKLAGMDIKGDNDFDSYRSELHSQKNKLLRNLNLYRHYFGEEGFKYVHYKGGQHVEEIIDSPKSFLKLSKAVRKKIIADKIKEKGVGVDEISGKKSRKTFGGENINNEIKKINELIGLILSSGLTTDDINFFRAFNSDKFKIVGTILDQIKDVFGGKIPSDFHSFYKSNKHLFESIQKTNPDLICYGDIQANKIIGIINNLIVNGIKSFDDRHNAVKSNKDAIHRWEQVNKIIDASDINFVDILSSKNEPTQEGTEIIKQLVVNKLIKSSKNYQEIKSILGNLLNKKINTQSDITKDDEKGIGMVLRLEELIGFVPSDFNELFNDNELIYSMGEYNKKFKDLKSLLKYFVNKNISSPSDILPTDTEAKNKFNQILKILSVKELELNFQELYNNDKYIYRLFYQKHEFDAAPTLVNATLENIKVLSKKGYNNGNQIFEKENSLKKFGKDLNYLFNIFGEKDITKLLNYTKNPLLLETYLKTNYGLIHSFSSEVDKIIGIISRLVNGGVKRWEKNYLLNAFEGFSLEEIKLLNGDRKEIEKLLLDKNAGIELNELSNKVSDLTDNIKQLEKFKIDFSIFNRTNVNINHLTISSLVSAINTLYELFPGFSVDQFKKVTNLSIRDQIKAAGRVGSIHKETLSLEDVISKLGNFNWGTGISQEEDINNYFKDKVYEIMKLKENYDEIKLLLQTTSNNIVGMTGDFKTIRETLEKNTIKFGNIDMDTANAGELLQNLSKLGIKTLREFSNRERKLDLIKSRLESLNNLIGFDYNDDFTRLNGTQSDQKVVKALFNAHNYVFGKTKLCEDMWSHLGFMIERGLETRSDVSKYVNTEKRRLRNLSSDYNFAMKFIGYGASNIPKLVKDKHNTIGLICETIQKNPGLISVIKGRKGWYDIFEQGKGLAEITEDLINNGIYENSDISNHEKEKIKKVLFTEYDVEETKEHVVTVPLYVKTRVGPFLKVKFYKAGHHAFGANQILLSVDKGNDSDYNLFFTGDLSRIRDAGIMGIPDIPLEDIHYLVIEMTYGNRIHVPLTVERKRLINSIKETCGTKGEHGNVFLIPSFMYQRAQDMLLLIYHLQREKLISRNIKVYLDGSNAFEFMKMMADVYEEYDVLFKWKNLNFIQGDEQRDQVIEKEESAIIVASGGMLQEGSASFKYMNTGLIKSLTDTIGQVGFASLGTPLRKIVDTQPDAFGCRVVDLTSQTLNILCGIERFNYSSHIDQPDLLTYLSKVIFGDNAIVDLNHGELSGILKMEEILKRGKTIPGHVRIVKATTGLINQAFTKSE